MKNIRRKDRAIETQEAIELLSNCEYGILSTVGENGQPYGIPLSYVYENNCIYFHCALDGHKIENIENNPKVSFCVIGNTKVLPEKFSTEYESSVAFGKAAEIHDPERNSALMRLIEKYSPEFVEEGQKYIEKLNKATKVIKIEIDHISGKARK